MAKSPQPSDRTRQKRRGFALIVVLGTLALVTILFLGVMSNAATELRGANAFENANSARSLADTAVNLVITQIRNGTQTGDTGSTSEPVVWASQPGMIRTYTASGAPKSIHKLYTDEAMVESAASFTPDLDSLPDDWNSGVYTDLYADLNRPGRGSENQLVYPVIDPQLTLGAGGDFVEGFQITDAPGYDPGEAPSSANNPAPMPVKWLYVLEDGSLVAPSLSGTTISVPGATDENPIVGRVAFWADDDTSKVNVNTASEGTFWDVPRLYSLEDIGKFGGSFSTTNPQIDVPGYAVCQPAQKEFQRYPGHPATTSLSPIFGSILPVPDTANPITTSTEAAQFEPYYSVSPRTHIGGSEAGTKVSTSALDIASDRLYSDFEELAFTQGRKSQNPLTPEILERRKFFLTSHSTAPETTLFNTPRLSMWPVHLTQSKRNTYDSLTAFCSTIGGNDFYFTRSNARSTTADLTPRNLLLYQYLQALTAQNIPGFGGNFLSKYGAGPSGITDRDQLLTYICDYIRCTNLQDRSQGATSFTPLYTAWGGTLGAGEAFPIRIGSTQGFGRFYTFSEACLQFYGTRKDTDGKTDKMRMIFFLEPASPSQGMACIRKHTKYRVKGLDKLKVDFMTGGGFVSLEMKPDGTNYMTRSDLATYHGRDIGGTEAPVQGIRDKEISSSSAGADARNKYPFISAMDVEIPSDAEDTFKFSAQNQEVTVEVRGADNDELIQTVYLKFPDGEFKIPGVGAGTEEDPDSHDYSKRNFGGTFQMIDATDTVVSLQIAGAITDPSDPNYATDSTAGDTRMIASLPVVPSDKFRPHDDYTKPGVQWAHTVLSATGHPFRNTRLGKLVPVVNYNNWRIQRNPDLPPCVGNQVTRIDGGPGDWDTGFGDQKDGAHINKPDEGDTALYDSQRGQNRPPYMLGYGQGYAAATKEYFSPNRQLPSSMMLGSLPTGVQRNHPWQTLLFHPRPEDPNHPGKQDPPDHLIADLFWMPVVEPYAISQPFATAGKVNMNYQIQPFTYIKRDTGIRSVMKSTKFLAMETGLVNVYKPLDPSNNHTRAPDRRRAIDLDKTLAEFDAKFASGDLFRSATQICELDLFPKGHSGSMASFWQSNLLTGDNLREKPYVDLYPRLTTKSNTFTVHIRTQVLKKARSTAPDEWVPNRDQVISEYNGSATVERFIDPTDPDLPDFAQLAVSDPTSEALDIDRYYRFRIINTQKFSP